MKDTSAIHYMGAAVVTLIAVFATAGIPGFWVRLAAGLAMACLGAFLVELLRRRAVQMRKTALGILDLEGWFCGCRLRG